MEGGSGSESEGAEGEESEAGEESGAEGASGISIASSGTGGDSQKQGAGKKLSARPGKGGVSRGRADAEIEYTNASSGSAFKSEKLPKGTKASRQWTVVGIGRSAPRDGNVTVEGGDTPQNAGESGSGRAAWQRRLAPSHRDAVKRFFDGKK